MSARILWAVFTQSGVEQIEAVGARGINKALLATMFLIKCRK